MNSLFFMALLVPCFSYYGRYNERYANFKYYEKERRTSLRYRKLRAMDTKHQYRKFNSISPIRGYDKIYQREQLDDQTNPNMWFPTIYNAQYAGTKETVSEYPWIAGVFHSPDGSYAYMCSAACIDKRIFITAARCIAQGQVTYMNVWYQNKRLKPIALVIPYQPTQQMFDDIGFIVVDSAYGGEWHTAQLYSTVLGNRTGNNFEWFEKFQGANAVPKYHVGRTVGYVAEGEEVTLYSMGCHMSNYFCYKYYDSNYFVPCYHPCSLDEQTSGIVKCNNYLAGEGHIVIQYNTNIIIGVATWGSYSMDLDHRLPVGMAVPNSKSFYDDYQCAKTIREAKTTGGYASLCLTRRINGY